MQIELKLIIDQLTEVLNLPEGERVAALIDNDKIETDNLVGWTIVRVHNDGTTEPKNKLNYYKNLKDLIRWESVYDQDAIYNPDTIQ